MTPTLADATLLPTPDSHAALVDLLTQHHLPVAEYGQGAAKSTHSIWAKIQKGETEFGEVNGQLVRILPAVARAMITYTDEHGLRYLLVENNQGIYAEEGMGSYERHLFGDYILQGLIERKSRWAVWETMRKGEDPHKAMVRGICEELVTWNPDNPSQIDAGELKIYGRFGIHSRQDLERHLKGHLQHKDSEEMFEPPLEYPALGTLYTAHTYHMVMPPFLLRHGYATRDEEGKLNLFGWIPADVSRDVIDAAKLQRKTTK